MEVLGYVRVSTRIQADGDSVLAQSEAIHEWADEHGHEVVGICADKGRSGTLDEADRPGLLDALDALREGVASALVVHRLDRLARALHVQEAILSQVWASGGEIYEVVGDRQVLRDDPEDPMRTFVRQVMGAAQQLERGLTVARMQGGRKRKAERSGYIGGKVPYGYEREGRGRAARLLPVPGEQRVIERIVRLRRRGRSLREIAARLNGDGIAAKEGRPWGHTGVAAVLRRAVL